MTQPPRYGEDTDESSPEGLKEVNKFLGPTATAMGGVATVAAALNGDVDVATLTGATTLAIGYSAYDTWQEDY